jgi:hypothetical protein
MEPPSWLEHLERASLRLLRWKLKAGKSACKMALNFPEASAPAPVGFRPGAILSGQEPRRVDGSGRGA